MTRSVQSAGGLIVDLHGAPTLTGKYRRNGKLQSCEPCRKRKLRCDHTVPVCQRCIKRQRAGECVYHPHPLTRSHRRPSQSPAAVPAPPASTPSSHSPPNVIQSVESTPHAEWHVASAPATSICHEPGAQVQAHRAASAPPLDWQRERAVRNPGFLGDTSYSSIFSEGLGKLDLDRVDLDSLPAQDVTISHDRILRGCQILAFLKERAMVNQFVGRWYDINDNTDGLCPQFIMSEWLLQLWAQHGDTLARQEPRKIRRLSELLWRNTQKPIVFDGKTRAKDWAHLGTGPNIRWEVIGLIATQLGLCAMLLDPSEPFLSQHNVTRHVLSSKMLKVAQTCLSFCRDCEMVDDMFVWLLINTAGLIRSVKGHRSYATYRTVGEANDAVVTMGLHQGTEPGERIPFFLAELRNKAMIGAYVLEIGLATFLGRPPRLSSRHCVLLFPKDLLDHQLALEGPELAAVLAGLDENGYNVTGYDEAGRVHQAAWMRCGAGYAPVREEILDMALGNYSSEEILQHAERVHAKMGQHWATLPPRIARALDGDADPAGLSALDALLRSALRNGALANELLLQRVLIRKAGASPERLIHTAQAIFHDILQLTQRHDIASIFHTDFTGLLTSHGLRSAAILAVELLKQEQLPVYPERPLLPKSQTVQDLSVFAARLGSVDPTDGSFSLCQQGRTVIARILDRILSPPPAGQHRHHPAGHRQSQPPQDPGRAGAPADVDLAADSAAMEAAFGVQDVAATGMCGFGSPTQAPMGLGHDYGFMQWLDGVDWQQPYMWNY